MPEKYYNITSFASLASQKIWVSLHMLIVLNESAGVTAVQFVTFVQAIIKSHFKSSDHLNRL